MVSATCGLYSVELVLAWNFRKKHEQEKKKAYEQRSIDVEHASFMPLVFSAVVGSVRKLPPSIRDLPLSSLINGTSPTVPQ